MTATGQKRRSSLGRTGVTLGSGWPAGRLSAGEASRSCDRATALHARDTHCHDPKAAGGFGFEFSGVTPTEVRSAVYRVDLLRPCGYWPSRRPPRWRRKFRRIPTNCSIRGSARRCYVARLCASDEMNRERSLNALLLKLTRENPAFTQLQSKANSYLGDVLPADGHCYL
jgi:hypothetical protein